jgi:hypothetical protein
MEEFWQAWPDAYIEISKIHHTGMWTAELYRDDDDWTRGAAHLEAEMPSPLSAYARLAELVEQEQTT